MIQLTREEAQQVLDALVRIRWAAGERDKKNRVRDFDAAMDVSVEAIKTLRARISEKEQAPVSLKQIAAEQGINMPDNYVPTIDDAIAAADGVLMNEQAVLLRECRAALDSLITQKPSLAGLHCGSTTLGNLKASLYEYRPRGVFGDVTPPQRPWQGLTEQDTLQIRAEWEVRDYRLSELCRAIEAKLKEKNT